MLTLLSSLKRVFLCVKKFVLRYPATLSALWTVFILFMCAVPGKYIPQAGWMAVLSIDKLVHATIFFILAILIILAAFSRHLSYRVTMVLLFLAVCYGILLEVLQAALFSERSTEVFDMLANSAGVVAAALFYKRLQKEAGPI